MLNFFSRSAQFLLQAALVAFIILVGFASTDFNASAQAAECGSVFNLEGPYSCEGGCAIKDYPGFFEVSGETDTVRYFPPAFYQGHDEFYEVTIEGDDGNFHEVEIGPLVGKTLQTSTAEVSDGIFPVVEDYIFETDRSCQATGFTKVVRNPSQDNFKSCIVYCDKLDW